MAAPVEVSFNLDIGQGDALEKMLAQLTQLSKQFEGAVKFKVGVKGAGAGAGGGVGAGGLNPAVARLIRGIPGGGAAMAFKSLGMIGGIATVALGIFSFVKKIFNSSKILGTISSTFFKVMGAMVDLMLAPLMPFMIRVLVWMVQKGFPLATKIGNWLAPVVETGAKALGGVGKITTGLYEGDPGKVWEGVKDLGGAIKDLSPTLAKLALLTIGIRPGEAEKFAEDFMASVDWGKSQFTLMKEFWTPIGGWIVDGIKSQMTLMKEFWMGVGGWIWESLKSQMSLIKNFWTGVGGWIWDGLKAALATFKDIFLGLGGWIWEGLKSNIPGAGILGSIFSKLGGGSNTASGVSFRPNVNGGAPMARFAGGGSGTNIGSLILNVNIDDFTLPVEINDQVIPIVENETLTQFEQLFGDTISLRSV